MFNLTLLDDLALLHHADAVGNLAHDAEIVGDEQHRHAQARLQVAQQLKNLCLHRDVERGGWLVRDQEVRLVGERHRDHDALALPARQLMRIASEPPGRDRVVPTCVRSSMMRVRAASPVTPPCSSRISPICRSIVCSGLSDVIGSWNTIVMSLPRTLRISDSGRAEQFLALESDAAGRVAGGRVGQQLHHRQRGDRFSRAGFADQRQRLALCDVERDAINRERRLAAGMEGDGQGRARAAVEGVAASIISPEHLARIERVAHRFADEDQQRQHDRDGEEPGHAEPRRLNISFRLR